MALAESFGHKDREGPFRRTDVIHFIGPGIMRVSGRGHAEAPVGAVSRGVRPWRAGYGLRVVVVIRDS